MYFAGKAGGDFGKVSPWWLILAYASGRASTARWEVRSSLRFR